MFESELFPESFDPFPHKVLISSKRFVMDFKSMKWIDQKGNCKGIKCWRMTVLAVLTREWVWCESSICSALKAQSSSSFSFLSFCLAALWASDLNMRQNYCIALNLVNKLKYLFKLKLRQHILHTWMLLSSYLEA